MDPKFCKIVTIKPISLFFFHKQRLHLMIWTFLYDLVSFKFEKQGKWHDVLLFSNINYFALAFSVAGTQRREEKRLSSTLVYGSFSFMVFVVL